MLRKFRIFIIAAAVLTVLGPLVDIIAPSLESSLQHGQSALDISGMSSTSGHVAMALALLSLLVGAVSLVGLYRLKRWSRSPATVSLGLAFAAYASLGEIIYSGLSFGMVCISMALWGAILSMAFFSELRSNFES